MSNKHAVQSQAADSDFLCQRSEWAQTSTYLVKEMGAMFEAFSRGVNTGVMPEGPQSRLAKVYG